MSSITITVVGDATAGTNTKTYTVSDADVNRMIGWAKKNYITEQVPLPTTAQALEAWFGSTMHAVQVAVTDSETDAKVAAVTDAVWTAT